MSDDEIEAAGFSERQWWSMCDAGMGLPVPLAKADLNNPFVYDRKYGVFYVPMGYHQTAMSLLLAFHHGLVRGIEVAEKLRLEYSSGSADEWLRTTPGAAFKSSVGKRIQAGAPGNLTAIERRILGDVEYVFDARRGPRP